MVKWHTPLFIYYFILSRGQWPRYTIRSVRRPTGSASCQISYISEQCLCSRLVSHVVALLKYTLLWSIYYMVEKQGNQFSFLVQWVLGKRTEWTQSGGRPWFTVHWKNCRSKGEEEQSELTVAAVHGSGFTGRTVAVRWWSSVGRFVWRNCGAKGASELR
jgi:hypothetical protein